MERHARTQPSRRPSRTWRWALVGVTCAAGATAAWLFPVHPTALPPVDRTVAAVLVAVVAASATRARRSTWIVLAGIVATFGSTPAATVLGLVGLLVASIAGWSQRRPPPVAGALVGALGGLASLRLHDGGRTGTSLLLGALAVVPIVVSGYRGSHRRTKRVGRIALGVAGVGLVAATAGYAVAVVSARASVTQGSDGLEAALAAARAGDVDEAQRRFDGALDALEEGSRQISAPWARPARLVPILGQNVHTLSGVIDVAERVSAAAAELVRAAGDDALAIRAGQIDLTAFERLDEPTATVRTELDRARARIANFDSPWLLSPVDTRLDDIRSELARASESASLVDDAIDALPALLGAEGAQRYLVLFVTPVEARALGFPGNFAELVVDDGRLDLPRFGRIGELVVPPEGARLDLPSEFLARYQGFGALSTWSEVTTSPDFPSVAALARQLYPQSGGRPIDGVLTVDPAGLAALLQLTGPVSIPQLATPLDATNAEDFLLRGQYAVLEDGAERVDALESLGRATFDRLTTGDLPPPQEFATHLGPVAEAGHLRLISFDDVGGPFLERIGVDHPLPQPSGDGLAVVSTNRTGNKIDAYLSRSVRYDARWDPSTGVVDATISVTLTNDAPTEGVPDVVIGNAYEGEDQAIGDSIPLGTNRTYLGIYSTLQFDEATLDGRPVAISNSLEGPYLVHEVLIDLPPHGGTATFELRATGTMLDLGLFSLDLWQQPSVLPDDLEIRIEITGDMPIVADGAEIDGRVAVRSGPVAGAGSITLRTRGD